MKATDACGRMLSNLGRHDEDTGTVAVTRPQALPCRTASPATASTAPHPKTARIATTARTASTCITTATWEGDERRGVERGRRRSRRERPDGYEVSAGMVPQIEQTNPR